MYLFKINSGIHEGIGERLHSRQKIIKIHTKCFTMSEKLLVTYTELCSQCNNMYYRCIDNMFLHTYIYDVLVPIDRELNIEDNNES